jgi:hypothetical protein
MMLETAPQARQTDGATVVAEVGSLDESEYTWDGSKAECETAKRCTRGSEPGAAQVDEDDDPFEDEVENIEDAKRDTTYDGNYRVAQEPAYP